MDQLHHGAPFASLEAEGPELAGRKTRTMSELRDGFEPCERNLRVTGSF